MIYDETAYWIENCRQIPNGGLSDQNHVTKHFKMMIFFSIALYECMSILQRGSV